jgi:hypothetical protein
VGTVDVEIAAAVLGGGMTLIAAVVIFVAERMVARHAAYVERRRAAFDEVIQAFGRCVTSVIETSGNPDPAVTAGVVTARARMTLALRVTDRALGWWLDGMERRFAEAVRELPAPGPNPFARVEAVNSNVVNTLIDLHAGAMNQHDMVIPATVFSWEIEHGAAVKTEIPGEFAAAERPRRRPENHGLRGWTRRLRGRTLLGVRRLFGREKTDPSPKPPSD